MVTSRATRRSEEGACQRLLLSASDCLETLPDKQRKLPPRKIALTRSGRDDFTYQWMEPGWGGIDLKGFAEHGFGFVEKDGVL